MSEELETLRRDGFCIARGLLPRADVTATLESVHRTIRDQLREIGVTAAGDDLHAALRALHAADIERYKRVLGALWRKADVSGLMRHPALFGFLREAFGWRDVFLPGGEVALLMAADLKIPGGYFGLGAHQDFPSVQGSLDGVVAWIPLTDVDRDGWPVEVIPGSHRRGLITEVDETRNGWEIRPEALDDADWRPVEVKAGDVVFLSVFTVHRSRREAIRRGCGWRSPPASTTPPSRPSWGAPIPPPTSVRSTATSTWRTSRHLSRSGRCSAEPQRRKTQLNSPG